LEGKDGGVGEGKRADRWGEVRKEGKVRKVGESVGGLGFCLTVWAGRGSFGL